MYELIAWPEHIAASLWILAYIYENTVCDMMCHLTTMRLWMAMMTWLVLSALEADGQDGSTASTSQKFIKNRFVYGLEMRLGSLIRPISHTTLVTWTEQRPKGLPRQSATHYVDNEWWWKRILRSSSMTLSGELMMASIVSVLLAWWLMKS